MKNIAITCALLAICDTYTIVDPTKCSLDDSECQQRIYKGILQDLADNGAPDIGVPVLDPFIIKDFEIIFGGLIKVVIEEGKATGFKTCASKSYRTDAKLLRTYVELECETFVVEGLTKLTTLPTLDTLLSGIKIHGDGDGKISLEKVHLNLDFSFQVVKQDDGEYHFRMNPEESQHSFEVLGKIVFELHKIFVGSQDVSTVAGAILNENWKVASKLFGPVILDNMMGIFYENVNKFFASIPAKDLIIDDLSTYTKS